MRAPGELPDVTTARALLLSAMALMGLGAVMVFSATANLDASLLPTGIPDASDAMWVRRWSTSTSLRQIGFAIVAALAMLVASRCPYRWWRVRPGSLWQPALLLLLVTVAALALVYVPGIGLERNGARRWVRLGPAGAAVGFQPSELAKPALVLILAAWMSRPRTQMRSFWKGLLPAATMIALISGIVGVEDLSTAALLGVVGGALVIAGGARIRHIAVLAMPAVVSFAYLLVSRPYRLRRLWSFTDIWSDPLGSGFHPIQSLLTIASGGWAGKGLGVGVQKLGYLPEGQTDFIFAVICEELGFAGGALVLGLFLALLWSGRRALLNAADDLGRYIVLGVMLIIGVQVAMNVGVVTVSMPTTGISLPLVSAGGSGLLCLGVAIGLVANVARGASDGVRPAVGAVAFAHSACE